MINNYAMLLSPLQSQLYSARLDAQVFYWVLNSTSSRLGWVVTKKVPGARLKKKSRAIMSRAEPHLWKRAKSGRIRFGDTDLIWWDFTKTTAVSDIKKSVKRTLTSLETTLSWIVLDFEIVHHWLWSPDYGCHYRVCRCFLILKVFTEFACVFWVYMCYLTF